MSTYEILSTAAALVAIIISVVAIYKSSVANNLSEKANEISAKANEFSKKSIIFSLQECWANINEIDPENPITPDVIRAYNALDITSNVWNNEIIDRKVFLDSYQTAYVKFYKLFINSDTNVPGKNKKLKDFITTAQTMTYDEIKNLKS